jgi:uncharacterized damage-inducible protein DinB
MAPIGETLVSEFREEAAITRRVLDRLPAEKLSWQPHAKSMTLGQLANHIAMIPGNLSRMTQADSFDASQANFAPPQPKDKQEIQATFEQSVKFAEEYLGGLTDQKASAPWSMMMKERTIFTKPRAGVVRTIMLNHWYHHRGQLSVYLRLLDVPVPVIYGRSADENPFG